MNADGAGSWIEIGELSWGDQHGVPFDIGGEDSGASFAPNPFAPGSNIVVALPEEESAVWFDKWGPPTFWAAISVKSFQACQKKHSKAWRSCTTPAIFAEVLADDSGRVPRHLKDLEQTFIEALCNARWNTRSKVLAMRSAGKVVDLTELLKPVSPEELPSPEGARAGAFDYDTCSYAEDGENGCVFQDNRVLNMSA